ncbi:MAG: hypothetical protein WCB32_14540 [Pseudolabrys sp.]
MIDFESASRPTGVAVILAVGLFLIAAADTVIATDLQGEGSATNARVSVPDNRSLPQTKTASGGRSIITVSNGITTSDISSGPGGLEASSDAPGMITISSGSNSVTLRGARVTLSGDVVLAPFATPGVTVTRNKQGGCTVQLDSYGGLAINADGNSKGIDIQLPEQLDDFNLD